MARGNHRQAAGHGFQHGIGNSFLVGVSGELTRMNEDMALPINSAQIILAEKAGQCDLTPEGQLIDSPN